jgi:hypothetical protein
MALSSDPDADAVMGSFDHPEAAHDPDAAAVLASFDSSAPATAASAEQAPTYDANLFRQRVGRDPSAYELARFQATKGQGWAGDPGTGQFTIGQAAVGGVEDAAAVGTGVVGRIAAAPAYLAGLTGIGGNSLDAARTTRNALTYQPRTPAGQAGMQAIGQIQPGEIVPRLLDVAGKPNAAQTVREVEERAGDVAPLAAEALGGFPVTRAAGRAGAKVFSPIQDPEAAPPTPFANSPQSMGAAQAVDPRLATASPPLQDAVRQAAQQTGGAVNRTAFENHLEADQHGVQLTEGQATRDPNQFSAEQNSVHPDIKARIQAQEGQMTDALDNIRREAAPQAVQNNPIENGQTAVDSLKAYDEPIKADIDAKYEAARAASAKGDLQMDGSSFVSDANAGLKPQSKFRFLPASVKGILDDVAGADGKMTLDDYQAYDTQLGNEIAKAKAAGDGNAAFAIGKVKEALNNTKPVGAETTQAKALFDTARSAAKARFDALDADPAYQAAVNDVSMNGVKRGQPSALADKFLDKYALQAPKANVDRLMGKLDTDGQDAVTSHTLSTIRDRAITPNGTVSPNGYNGALEKYGPKLDSLVPRGTQDSLESLGRVITNAKVPPPGHSVNFTKSGVVMNAAKGVGSELGGAMVNAKTFGMGMPVIRGIADNAFAKRSLAPGAGLTKLSPTAPPGAP